MRDHLQNQINRAIIGIGSNIDPLIHVSRCLNILRHEQVVLVRSRFSFTKPLGLAAQPDFLNGAVMIGTRLSFRELESYLKALELRLGRVHLADKNGPRAIDLDIVIWNGAIVDPDYHQRDFLKRAVWDIARRTQLYDKTG